ncbi:MAG TPA: permease prefix domain 1-containing protein [Longimicrobiaceae bacterium]|nr:permease prefix domain 1-containing protein [Longimicrobiaceae bacterium]
MAVSQSRDQLEEQIDQWRGYLRRHQAISPADVEELEDHLRGQVATLTGAGLSADEAFLVAVKRLGALDAISNEFAREHSERLWKQLVVAQAPSGEAKREYRKEFMVVLALAVAAALAVKVPELFGVELSGTDDRETMFYVRNFSLFVLPLLTGYFVWKRGVTARTWGWLALLFVVALVVANIYPFQPDSDTAALTALHLPIALWLVVGVAYVGGRWRDSGRRMDFVRFSGELFIYYVLIALGGGVLIGFTMGMFEAIGIDAEWMVEDWLVPCGALGAVIIGSWLVEAKQSVIENMAPVLTRLFTPLFAATLLIFLATMAWTGRGIDIERNILIAFDLLLVLVFGMLLYSVSARDREAPRDLGDLLLVVLVICALITDGVALAAIGARISEFGFTPNRVAALGENVVLLVNLAVSAGLYVRFMRGRGSFAALERWQMAYLPVYAVWAAVVVVLFPLIFGFA